LYSPALGENCCQQLQTRTQPTSPPIPKEYFQIRRAFFLCGVLPTSCPLVQIEGDFPPGRPTPLYTNCRKKSKSGRLSFESKRSTKKAKSNFSKQIKVNFPPHISPFFCLFISRGCSRRFLGIVSERFGRLESAS